jgi:hypothetical protein
MKHKKIRCYRCNKDLLPHEGKKLWDGKLRMCESCYVKDIPNVRDFWLKKS